MATILSTIGDKIILCSRRTRRCAGTFGTGIFDVAITVLVIHYTAHSEIIVHRYVQYPSDTVKITGVFIGLSTEDNFAFKIFRRFLGGNIQRAA